MWAVRHYEPTAHNLFTFLPSTIFKLDFDNADRHVMSRTFRIMKKEGIWLRDPFDFGFNMKGVRKLFELGMLLWQNIQLCDCANYIPGSAVWVQHSTTTWPWQWKPLKNCCVITQSSGRSAWIWDENGRRLSWAETDHVFAVERWRYTVGYQQFVQGDHRPAVLSMFNWLRTVSRGRGTAPSAARYWHRNTTKQWLCAAIRKLPKLDGNEV